MKWLAAALLLPAAALAHHVELLPPLEYEPPAPGSYVLHRIMPAPDGKIVGLSGKTEALSRYTRGAITLLGFIYTTCTDPDGCPLAYRVFDALNEEIGAAPRLRDKVRFVTLSFDPLRDTPGAMREYAGSREKGTAPRWYFLTTRSGRELEPLVDGFGQDVRRTRSGRELSHVLKVFLIDREGDVREIYGSNFLHPRAVLNDIETLLLEER
jgi:cytochrome c peroxidase/protein SCO1/2